MGMDLMVENKNKKPMNGPGKKVERLQGQGQNQNQYAADDKYFISLNETNILTQGLLS